MAVNQKEYTIGNNSFVYLDMCNMWACAVPRNKFRKQVLELHKIQDICFKIFAKEYAFPPYWHQQISAEEVWFTSSPPRHHHGVFYPRKDEDNRVWTAAAVVGKHMQSLLFEENAVMFKEEQQLMKPAALLCSAVGAKSCVFVLYVGV